MSYKILKQRVLQAERDFEASIVRTEQSWTVMKRTLKYAMTPARILASGFGAGLLTGFTAPLAKLNGGAKLVQFITSVVALVGATEAKEAAEQASDAADTAADTACEVAEVADPAAMTQAGSQAVSETAAIITPDSMRPTARAREPA